METNEHIETIGLMADKVDNLLHALELPLSNYTHLKGMKVSLPEVRDKLRETYIALTGENPWSED